MDPLFRWYGGKRARIKHMNFPDFDEFREPFVGGGAVYFSLAPSGGWINDSNPVIVNFYRVVADKKANTDLRKRIMSANYPDVEEVNAIKDRLQAFAGDSLSVDVALDFIVGNRFLYRARINGRVSLDEWQGNKRRYKQFNRSKICKTIAIAYRLLRTAKITCGDFSNVIEEPGENVFMFIDPPYVGTDKKVGYDDSDVTLHERLAGILKKTKHRFILTYEDDSYVKKLYSWANITSVAGKYQGRTAQDKSVTELFINNF